MHKYGAYKVRRNAKKRLSPLDYRKGRKTAPVKDKAEFGAMMCPPKVRLLLRNRFIHLLRDFMQPGD